MIISFNLEMMAKKVRISAIHIMQNGQHFFSMGRLSQVSVTKLFTGKGQWFAFLHENCTYAFSQGITFQNKSFSEVGQSKYWGYTRSIFQILEGLICNCIPSESIFLK